MEIYLEPNKVVIWYFKIASIKSDYKILLQAKKDSKEYLLNKETDNDPLKIKLIESITKG